MRQPLPLFDTPPQSIVEALERTIQLLEQGWCKNYAAKANGHIARCLSPEATECCLLGGMFRATSLDESFDSISSKGWYFRLETWVSKRLYYNTRAYNLIEFNDHPQRTKSEVLDFLKDCLREAKFLAKSAESPCLPAPPTVS